VECTRILLNVWDEASKLEDYSQPNLRSGWINAQDWNSYN